MTTLTIHIPTLTTERLTLRAPREDDMAQLGPFFADAEYSAGFGGPLPGHEAWRWHALSVGHWLFRGYGYFSLDLTATGEHIGLCGLWNPEGWPEPELGWVLYKPFQGHGYAREAALAVRDWAHDALGMAALTSNIVPGNTASARLARALGAHCEAEVDNPFMGKVQVWRHPAPDEDGSVEAYA